MADKNQSSGGTSLNQEAATVVHQPMRPHRQAFSIRTKVLGILALLLIGFAMPRFIAFRIIETVKVGSPLYQGIIAHKDVVVLLGEIQSGMHLIRAESFNLIDEPGTDKRQEIIARIEEIDEAIYAKFASLEKIAARDLQPGIRAVRDQFKEFDAAIDDRLKVLVAQNNEAAARKVLTDEQAERFRAVITDMGSLQAKAATVIKVEEEKAQEIIRERITLSILVSLGLFIIVVACILMLMRSIVRSFRSGLEFAETVSSGDLTTKLATQTDDEMGALTAALNRMVDNLSNLVTRVHSSAGELARVSDNLSLAAGQVAKAVLAQKAEVDGAQVAILALDQSVTRVGDGVEILATTAQDTTSAILDITATIDTVAETAKKLSQAVDEVSSSIVEMAASIRQVGSNVLNLVEASSVTAASIFEMDASIREVQENAATTAGIAGDVRQDAETGRQTMAASMAGMAEIRRSSQITAEVIDTLSAKTGAIGDILSVIDEVAEQTNLLALNAAIIAAQAGEHGKGFAVVADEIKELAERTSSSTREIADVIKAVQDDTSRAVAAIAIAERVIIDGEFLSGRSDEALNKIVAGVQQVTDRMNQIAVATYEQSRGSQVIRDAMERVSGMVEQIASATREQSRGSDLIIQAVDRMKTLTSQVQQATSEQSNVGSSISAHTDKVATMIAHIRTDCTAQRQEGERLVKSVEELRAANISNVATSEVMGQAVVTLTHQIEVLQQEISVFKVSSLPEPTPVSPDAGEPVNRMHEKGD
jgi:methyl-accepting chemotaxis protein